jgi:hypothetical protein
MTSNRIATIIQRVTGGATSGVKGISGSLTKGSMDGIWEIMGDKANDKCFYDIGASVGHAIFYAALHGARHSTGCEFQENSFLGHYFDTVKRELLRDQPTEALQTASITFEAFSTVPDDANIVYTFNKGFDFDTQELIMQQVRAKQNVELFVCSKNPFYKKPDDVLAELGDAFRLMGQVKCRMTGSQEHCIMWVFERV